MHPAAGDQGSLSALRMHVRANRPENPVLCFRVVPYLVLGGLVFHSQMPACFVLHLAVGKETKDKLFLCMCDNHMTICIRVPGLHPRTELIHRQGLIKRWWGAGG